MRPPSSKTVTMDGAPSTSIQLRYSRAKFKTTVFSALLLTGMVTGVTHMALLVLHNRNAFFWTVLTAMVFFGFCSAQMLWRFYNRDVILAVRPTGLYDARISSQIMPWETIKEVVLHQREMEHSLEIVFWPVSQNDSGNGVNNEPVDIDLSPFDTSLVAVTEAINEHVPLRFG